MVLSLPVLILLLASGLAVYLFGIALVWRRDRLTAVFTLLLPPLALYTIAKYWGEREANPRWYLLAGLVLLGFGAAVLGGHLLNTPVSHDVDWLRSHDADEARRAASARARRARALASLVRSSGSMEIPNAVAGIAVPQHFRFIERAELVRAFGGTADAPADDTVGWLVHERVDLTTSNAWHVRVDYRGDGYVANRGLGATDSAALLAALQQARQPAADDPQEPPQVLGFADLPTFDPITARATWVLTLARPRSQVQIVECHAARLGRKGVVLFTIEDMAAARQELCLRSVRLLAAHVQFGVGQSWTDHSRMLDRNAPYGLADLITGRYGPAEAEAARP